MAEQLSFVGDGPGQAPAPTHEMGYPGVVRLKLHFLLKKLRAADRMPLDERTEWLTRKNVPVMLRWLPQDEADAIRIEYNHHMARLSKPLG